MSGIKYSITVGPADNCIEDITISMHQDRPELIRRIESAVHEYFKGQEGAEIDVKQPASKALYSNYTAEQIEEIRKQGYWCECRDSDVDVWSEFIATLDDFDADSERPFLIAGQHWAEFRVAERPWNWRPHFGGPCPVADETLVVMALHNGLAARDWAYTYNWQTDVEAFCTLPEVAR